jgi:hypothetical protein
MRSCEKIEKPLHDCRGSERNGRTPTTGPFRAATVMEPFFSFEP